MSKVIKKMEMDALKDTFKGVRDLVALNTRGLSCQGDYTFRANLRKKNIRLRVVKNSLARKVFDELGIPILETSPTWVGQTMFAFGAGSIAQLSREIDTELKSPKLAALYKDKVSVKRAIADGQEVTFEVALKMPTREEAIARVIMLALSPASRLVSALTGPGSALSSQLKSIADKKPEEPAPAAPPAA
jgi:large subunit ribosomal protein L10